MTKSLHNPQKTLIIPNQLFCIPYFWDHSYLEQLKQKAIKSFPFFLSEILVFEQAAILTHFLGYSQLLTTLAFIKEVKQKTVFFLGTAGSLSAQYHTYCPLGIDKIYPSSIFCRFSTQPYFQLHTNDLKPMAWINAVSVDLIERETSAWLKKQQQNNLSAVEMEIFPLQWYVANPLTAVVITTDLVTGQGIIPFTDKKRFKQLFVQTFEIMWKKLGALYSCSD
jgi:hypothetical protein